MDPHDPHSPHRRAWDAIPWFVAGSASAEDAALLQGHLTQCAECRDELRFQQQVHDAMQASPQAVPDPAPALQRVLARIDARQGRRALPAAAWRGGSALTRWLAAAVVVQAVGLGAAGVALHESGRQGDYRTLSQSTPVAAAGAILLVPAPGLDFGALRQLLSDTRLDIVDLAPDASALHLAPRDGAAATVAAALPRLRALPGVMLAEPTGHAR